MHVNNDNKTIFICFRKKKYEFRLQNGMTSEPALFIHLLSQSYVFEVSRPLFFVKFPVFLLVYVFSQKSDELNAYK